MNESSPQIPLEFNNSKVKTFNDFVVGKNLSIIESLNSFSQSDETIFYLWGESGSGKSHLLQAFINRIGIDEKTAVLLNPKELSIRQNVSLIEMYDYVCIDDVEKIAKNAQLEEALFFWINEVKQVQKKIILSSQISNNSDNWQLPDLKSRLQAGRTHELNALNRQAVLQVFNKQAQDMGIVIDKRVNHYLETNCPINLSFLSQLLNQLDKITLIEKKQVTIPLLKKILSTKLVN